MKIIQTIQIRCAHKLPTPKRCKGKKHRQFGMKALSFCHICCTMQISTAQFWVNSSSWYFRIKSIRVLSAENFMCISIMGLDECKFDMFSTWFGILFSVDVNGIVLETKLVLHRLSQFLFSFNLFSYNFDGIFWWIIFLVVKYFCTSFFWMPRRQV